MCDFRIKKKPHTSDSRGGTLWQEDPGAPGASRCNLRPPLPAVKSCSPLTKLLLVESLLLLATHTEVSRPGDSVALCCPPCQPFVQANKEPGRQRGRGGREGQLAEQQIVVLVCDRACSVPGSAETQQKCIVNQKLSKPALAKPLHCNCFSYTLIPREQSPPHPNLEAYY